MIVPRQIVIYGTASGHEPFVENLAALKDRRAVSIIRARLKRAEIGNLGDWRGLGEGLAELRIHFGPGYRIYFGLAGTQVIVLLCAGDKGSQSADIERARQFWDDYRRNL